MTKKKAKSLNISEADRLRIITREAKEPSETQVMRQAKTLFATMTRLAEAEAKKGLCELHFSYSFNKKFNEGSCEKVIEVVVLKLEGQGFRVIQSNQNQGDRTSWILISWK